MFTRIVSLIATLILTPALALAADNKQAAYEDCVILLSNRLDQGVFSPWSKLPESLAKVNKATVIVRLSLEKASPTLAFADKLSTQIEGLRIPLYLRIMHESSFGFVAHGDREHLTALYERINKAKAANFASFQFPDYVVSREPLTFPKDSIPLDEKGDLSQVDAAIAAHMETGGGFSVYNVKESQPVFFVPRAQVPEDLNSHFLLQQRVSASSLAANPKSFANWILGKSKALDKKTIFNFENWSVVSASAFRRLYEWNRLHAANLPDIDEEFNSALEDYCGISCRELPASNLLDVPAGAAPSPAAAQITAALDESALNTMNAAGRSRVLAYLRAHRGDTPITSPGGLREAFEEIGNLIQDTQARKTYLRETRQIGITPSEHNLLYSPGPARERFSRQWRAFLRGMGNPYAADAFTTRNLQKGISLLPD